MIDKDTLGCEGPAAKCGSCDCSAQCGDVATHDADVRMVKPTMTTPKLTYPGKQDELDVIKRARDLLQEASTELTNGHMNPATGKIDEPEVLAIIKQHEAVIASLSEMMAYGSTPLTQSMSAVIKALKDDPDYAWSWHCNVAMAAADEGLPHYQANNAAARFMYSLANVDTTKHPGFPAAPAVPDHTKWPPIPLSHCNPEQFPEPRGGFTTALDIRTAQGWNLTGKAVPVLYTDTINDQQVMRDDVWLCTTEALADPGAPAVPAGWSDDQVISFAAMILLQGNHADSIEMRLGKFREHEAMRGNSAPSVSAAPKPQADEVARNAARYLWLRDVSVPPHNFYLSVPDEFDGVKYKPTEVDAYIDAALAAKPGGAA